jgi:hypothetical protein
MDGGSLFSVDQIASPFAGRRRATVVWSSHPLLLYIVRLLALDMQIYVSWRERVEFGAAVIPNWPVLPFVQSSVVVDL